MTGSRALANVGPPSEENPARLVDTLIELNERRLLPGSAVLDTPEVVQSIWGQGHQSLWAAGEPLLICGPDGVGKTTLAQQLALAISGIGERVLLGLPVTSEEKRVLYLACDRPAQARRSLRRMVQPSDRDLLDEQLVIWSGPLPFDLGREPHGLRALAVRASADAVVIDSLKDVAADLSREETGVGLNAALQEACAEGVDVVALHHQRKAQANAAKPKALADVYGSRWIVAGCGSVLMLWGDAGDPVIELTHLKQPDEPIGPLTIVHDHATGRTTIAEIVDSYSVVLGASGWVTVGEVAQLVYGNTDRNSREKARRQLERMASEHKIHRQVEGPSGQGGKAQVRYCRLSVVGNGVG